MTTALCPFCNHELDIDLFNGTYGCDSGCEYVSFEVECPGCKREIYRTGEFGSFGDSPWDEPEDAYRERFMAEFAEEVAKINARKAGN